MTKKMATRDLSYKLGLLSYGDSKLAKWKITIKKMGSSSSNLVYGEQVFSDVAKNGTMHFQQELIVSKTIL